MPERERNKTGTRMTGAILMQSAIPKAAPPAADWSR